MLEKIAAMVVEKASEPVLEKGFEKGAETLNQFGASEVKGLYDPTDRPLHELGKEGIDIHNQIQDSEIREGRYTHKEIPVKNHAGEIIQRPYEFQSGPRLGETKLQGSRYDLYNESDTHIKTAEIKPYTDSGIKAAEEKYNLQKDLEDNYGGNKGKEIFRESIFYDPNTHQIAERCETTIEKLNSLYRKLEEGIS